NKLTLANRLTSLENSFRQQQNKSWFSGINSQLIVVSIFFALLFSILLMFISKSTKDNNGHISNEIKDYVKKKVNEAEFKPQNNRRRSSMQDVNGLQTK